MEKTSDRACQKCEIGVFLKIQPSSSDFLVASKLNKPKRCSFAKCNESNNENDKAVTAWGSSDFITIDQT